MHITKKIELQLITYRTKRDQKSSKSCLCSVVGPAVAPGDTEVWMGHDLRIPPSTLPSNIINIAYNLSVSSAFQALLT